METIRVTKVHKNLAVGLAIPVGDLVVFTGQNNSGKSAILQYLNMSAGWGVKADYISPRRFDASNEVAVGLRFGQETKQQLDARKRYDGGQAEFQAPDPIRELLSLDDADRRRAIEWHNRYFGDLRIERSSTTNEWSAPKVVVDGRLVTEQGSGSRAVLAILSRLFDPTIEYLLIDEPEIGVEPQVQRKLLELIRKVSKGEEGTPRKKVLLATHSHLFLDKQNLGNNFIVAKGSTGSAEIRPISTEQELHDLVFRLLGNSPVDLFFPSNIIVVEGPSDRTFVNKVLRLRGGDAISVHYADNDEKVGSALPAIDQMLKSTSYISLYRERICVLVDLQKKPELVDQWRKFVGDVTKKRVVQLSKNDIEHFYPKPLLAEISGVPEAQVEAGVAAYLDRVRKGDRNAALGRFVGGKVALATAVADRLTATHLPTIEPTILALVDEAIRMSYGYAPPAVVVPTLVLKEPPNQ